MQSAAVEEALTRPLGARWVRAALQVNPYGYEGAAAPSRRFDDEAHYNSALLSRCLEQNIELLAVTDHWCVDRSAGLLSAATSAGIAALPGFEANSSEGVHLLVIFDQGAPLSSVNAAIGECGATPGCANGTTGKPFREILEAMTRRGALVIPAHANVAARGLFTAVSGGALQQMVTHPDLQALAVTPSQDEATNQALMIGGFPPFTRPHPLAEIHADDVCSPDSLARVGATTWFKVSEPGLAGVKVAVRAPVTRVRTADPATAARTVLRALAWQGGFLDGVRLSLAEDLTALIGGRGTGKSTVVETIRYVLGLDPLGPAATRDHHELVQEVLRPGTTCSLVVDAVTPAAGRYVIERTVPEPPIVRDASGTPTALRPGDVVGVVEVFGQHELAELAQDKTCVARMLERFSGHEPVDAQREELLQKLARNREALKEAEEELTRLEDDLADLPRLKAQVEQYDSSRLSEGLEDQRLLQRDEGVFTEVEARIRIMEAAAAGLLEGDLPGRTAAKVNGVSDSPRSPTLGGVDAVLRALADAVTDAQAAIRTAAARARTDLALLRTSWQADTTPIRDQHAEVLRQLADQGLDGNAYLATTKAYETLSHREQDRPAITWQLENLGRDRQGLLAQLSTSDTAAASRLREAIRTANAATGGVVVVRPVPSPDRQVIKNVVERLVRGQRTQIMAAIDRDDFSARAFVAAARESEAALAERFGVRGVQASAVRSADEPFFRELEEHSVGLAAEVRLDVGTAPQRRHKRLEDLSKGQRATALLLLLLGASTSPLVIDQPEDDLDNRFIYDGVVKQLRSLKGARQIIVSTHNANVPVLGDAELVVALEGDGDHGWPVAHGVGSLDEEPVRALAEDLLEGGRAAFDARRYLYGF